MQPSGPTTANTSQRPSGTGLAFAVAGVPVRLHFTFVLLVIFLIAVGVSGGQSALLNAVYILALFASVLLHELGHVGVSMRYGIRTLEIVMYPIGGLARLERIPKPREELWIALAGPFVNVLIFTAIYAYLVSVRGTLDPTSLMAPTNA